MAVSFQWLGHSCFLLDVDGRRAIIDPFITSSPLAPVSIDDIDASVVLLTHAHSDHVGDTSAGPAGDTITLGQRGAIVVGNFEIASYLAARGLQNLHYGNTGGTYNGDFLSARFTKAFHSSSFGDGTYGGQPHGIVIRARGYTLYHAGDTELFSDMQLIGDMGLDVAFVPIGDTFTMGPDESIRAIQFLRPRYVVPMHYNTFPPIAVDVSHWAQRVHRETNAQPIVLDPGNAFTLE